MKGDAPSTTQEALARLGLTLPKPPTPVASYLLGSIAGDLVFVSGQTCVVDGRLAYHGRLGDELTWEDGYEAARLAALNCLAELQAILGGLERVSAIVKVNGYVCSVPGFEDQPRVVDGASDLMEAVFGPSGRHARTSVGVAELPGGAPVEIELIARIRPEETRAAPGRRREGEARAGPLTRKPERR